MKQRIAILTHNMVGGGAERFVSHLLSSFANDYETHLILFENTIEYKLPNDQIIEYIENGSEKRSNLFNILRIPLASYRLRKYCEKQDIQLVISFLNRPNFTACMAKLLGLKVPLLISERTYTPLWFKEDDLRGKIAKKMVTWLYSAADAILSNSKGTRWALENHYGVKSNHFVIKNIVDIDAIKRLRHKEVSNIGFEKFTFLHLGSFSHMKGHRMLVNAFARLGRKDAQLLLIGKGQMLEETKRLVADLDLEDQIFFIGHQSNPFKFMHRADCFVLASDFEGFPNVLTEAMACGLPIISTDCLTGPRELLAPDSPERSQITDNFEPEKFGILVPVNDEFSMVAAMKEMMDNELLRISYKTRIEIEVVKYDRNTVIEDLNQIIKQFLPKYD